MKDHLTYIDLCLLRRQGNEKANKLAGDRDASKEVALSMIGTKTLKTIDKEDHYHETA